MNKLELNKTIKENWYKYHLSGLSNIHRIKRNAIFLNRTNDLAHELKKLEVCYGLHSFITESVCNKTGKRHDVVDLVTNTIYEVVNLHETDQEIQKYREEGIIPIIVNPFTCSICKKQYPKRSKRDTCSICNSNRKL